MLKSRYMICAEGLSIDQATGNATVFSIIDTMVPATFPAAFPRIVIICNLERDQDDPPVIKIRLLVTLGDTSVGDFPVDVSFFDKSRANVAITLEALPIHGPGKLIFACHLDGGDVLAKYEIMVNSPPVKSTQVVSSQNP